MKLTREEHDHIRAQLEAGATPEDIANSIGRINDLDEADVAAVRAAAVEVQAELAADAK